MSQIIFQIDFEKEAWNWVRVGKQKKHNFGRNIDEMQKEIPSDVLKKIQRLPKDEAIKLVSDRLVERSDNFMPWLEANKGLLEFYFKNKGDELFKVLERITQKKIYTNKFYAAFTLMTSSPYDTAKNWFMIPAKKPAPHQIQCICHEILHLQFIFYYRDYCLESGLDNKQFEDLKEATTFLLNEPMFKKFYLARDRGYSNHQELRKKLKQIWDKNKKFDKFIDKAIEIIKL